MSNYWTDWSQNARIDAAEAEIAAQRRARARLADQLREQHGDLQAQLDRLTEAFVALLAHEDIRGELAQHSDAAAVRRYARELVAALVVTGHGVVRTSAEPADVPGYWLAAVVRGITRAGEDAGAGLLDEAVRRDPRRTAAFLTLLDCVTRQVRWSGGHLARVLPQEASVDRVQRQTWLAVADDRLGPGARAELERALGAAVAVLEPGQVDEAISARLVRDSDAADPAPRRLARLRALVEGVDPDVVEDADVAGARRVRLPALAAEEPAADPDPAPEDPLADVLRDLVDAGSPAEGDILFRMAEARQQLGYVEPDRAAADPMAPAGNLLDLLVDDLARPTATPGGGTPEDGTPGGGTHGVALRVLAPAIERVAAALEAEADAPAPHSRRVDVGRDQVEVSTAGAAPGWEDAARRYADSIHEPPRWPRPAALVCLVLGLGAVGLGLAAPGWFVLAVVLLAGAGGLALHDNWQRNAAKEAATVLVQRAAEKIEQTAQALRAGEQAQAAGLVSARGDRQRIRAVLAEAVPVAGPGLGGLGEGSDVARREVRS